ncbi:hypothetical protein [Clostridium sp. Marseille-Q7071]
MESLQQEISGLKNGLREFGYMMDDEEKLKKNMKLECFENIYITLKKMWIKEKRTF